LIVKLYGALLMELMKRYQALKDKVTDGKEEFQVLMLYAERMFYMQMRVYINQNV